MLESTMSSCTSKLNTLVVLCAVGVVTVSLPVAAAPAAIFRSLLPRIQKQTQVPIRLPSQLPSPLRGQKLYASGQGDRDSYSISLASRPRCGANACFIGYFSAKRGDQPSFEQALQLANGIEGHYKPLSCGGSCSPPMIEWVQNGVLYTIQMEVSRKPEEAQQTMVQMANSSITGQ